MANTPSNMVPLGTPAPAFDLPNPATRGQFSSTQASGRPMLVMFICNHCPFVVHIMDALDLLEADYAKSVQFVAINSNSVISHPQDGPANMAALVQERGWQFPFLFDETQEVARAYQAACTPDFFLYDDNHTLVYRGQFDETRPSGGEGPEAHGSDLRAALDALLAGKPPIEPQHPSMGCNIKWNT